MLEQGIDYLFNEVSLYTKEVFNVFELKNDKYEDREIIIYKSSPQPFRLSRNITFLYMAHEKSSQSLKQQKKPSFLLP